MPTPKLAFGTATLKGKILDYQKEMMQQMKMHIESPALNVHNEQNIIKIKEDGTFSGGGQDSVRYKCSIRTSFWLDRVSDSSQRRDIAHHQYKGTMPQTGASAKKG